MVFINEKLHHENKMLFNMATTPQKNDLLLREITKLAVLASIVLTI